MPFLSHLRRAIVWGAFVSLIAPVVPQTRAQSPDRKAEIEAKQKADQEAKQAARDKIAEFNKAISGKKNPADIASAIRILDLKHPMILERLIRMLSGPGDEAIHTAVIEMLVAQDDPRCVPALNDMLRQLLLKPRENSAITITLLKAVGHYGDRRSAPNVVAALDSNDNAVAQAGCEVAGKVKDPMIVDELIKLLREAEQPDTYIPAGGAGGAAGLGRGYNAVNRRKALRDPAQKSLRDITGKSFGSARDWKDWWSRNRAQWKPDAPK